jgi:tetratricopeptide (TPR) repeat protein
VETAALAGEAGHYRLEEPVPSIEVPATVEEVLAARIERVPPDPRQLLECAAAVGRMVPYDVLSAIADRPAEDIHEGVRQLQAAELLYETGAAPTLELTFKHPLTHEVAYRALGSDRRRALHARIVDAFESLHPERLEEMVDRLASHALAGEAWEKATTYLYRAGDRAADRADNRQAVARFEQALSALGHLPETRERLQLSVDIHFRTFVALWQLGELRQQVDALREADAVARALGDRRRQGRVAALISFCYWCVNENDRALEGAQRALAIAEDLSDLHLTVEGNFYLALARMTLGDLRGSIEIFTPNLAVLEDERAALHRRFRPTFRALYAAYLARSLGELGKFEEGLATAQRAIQAAESGQTPLVLMGPLFGAATVQLRRGDFEAAIPLLERALVISRTVGIENWFPSLASSLGYAYAHVGRAAEGLALAEQAADRALSTRITASYPLWLTYLGEAYLVVGRRSDALSCAERALEVSRAHAERSHEAWALRLLGDVAAAGGPAELEQAWLAFEDAGKLAHELGMRPLVARCELGLARLACRSPGRADGSARLARAASLLRELQMPGWLEPLDA